MLGLHGAAAAGASDLLLSDGSFDELLYSGEEEAITDESPDILSGYGEEQENDLLLDEESQESLSGILEGTAQAGEMLDAAEEDAAEAGETYT